MTTNDRPARMLDALHTVTFSYGCESHLVGDEPDEVGTLVWEVTAHLNLHRTDAKGWLADPDVGFGDVGSLDAGYISRVIFQMTGFTYDLWQVRHLWDALDATSVDTAHFGVLAVDARERGCLNPRLEEFVEGVGGHLVIVDRAAVAPAWRGLGGVGRLLIGNALRWIGANAQCIAVHPFPLEFSDADPERDDVRVALGGVQRTWRALGFEPFREDLYVLDPASNTMEAELARLGLRLLPRSP